MPFRFLTAGESHGEALVAIIEGLPAGILIDVKKINDELSLRQTGFGRSGRMKLETDRLHIISGLRKNKTIGSPITCFIKNNDWDHHETAEPLFTPRPGHADLAGTLKFNHADIRLTLERASARETAIRTAIGAICQQFLHLFEIEFLAFVIQIGKIKLVLPDAIWSLKNQIEASPLLCPDFVTEKTMTEQIQIAQREGNTVGGQCEVRVRGLPVGLGNFSQWDLRLDGRLAQAIMSIPAIKGVEIGDGYTSADHLGSQHQDEIFYKEEKNNSFGYYRKTNHNGGLEGGVTTGEELIVRAAMKPLPTLSKMPLRSVNIVTKESAPAIKQRTDTCAVPAAAIVAKNVIAIELVWAFLDKFSGDSIEETTDNFNRYLKK